MTSIDDHLHELFAAGGPAADELRGDLRQVRARVRQRALRRRAAFGAVAAGIVAGGAFLLINRDGGNDVRTDLPPVTQNRTPITTAPDRSTPQGPVSSGPGTTPSTSSTSSSSTTSTPSTSTTSPPGPSIRDAALGEATYANACPGFDDGRSATLRGGTTSLPVADGVTHEVELGAVGYGDADGDGDEDAVLLLRCVLVGADTASTAQLRAYRTTSEGSIEQIGSSNLLQVDVYSSTAAGLTITVVVELNDAHDARCCPSSAENWEWRFDGSQFVLTGTTPATTPNTPR